MNTSTEMLECMIEDLEDKEQISLKEERYLFFLKECLTGRNKQKPEPVLWEIDNPGEGTYYTPHKPSNDDYRYNLIVNEFYEVKP